MSMRAVRSLARRLSLGPKRSISSTSSSPSASPVESKPNTDAAKAPAEDTSEPKTAAVQGPVVEFEPQPAPTLAMPTTTASHTSTSVKLPLTAGWKFGQTESPTVKSEPAEWFEASKFPTNVHSELLAQGKIPDPFVGLNEYDVQWVGEKGWVFETELEIDEKVLERPLVDLVFEGLDTVAEVQLNGHLILQANNMFVEYRVPVKDHLKADGKNILSIYFPSTYIKGLEIEASEGKKQAWNGHSSRVHVRKAQYHYGWDWGPNIMTVGPWKPIHLHAYNARISDLHIKTDVSESLDVKLDISITASTSTASELGAILDIKKPDGGIIASHAVQLTTTGAETNPTGTLKGALHLAFGKGEVELWWPVGYGAQPLYTVEVRLQGTSNADADDIKTQSIGFRRVKVVQEPLEGQEGLSFLFEINNVRIFIGGSNWIPADSFLTDISADRYISWLKLMIEGNQNMIRIWGGGIYEPDVFYDTCDKLGILVWQDFMFACGQYPAYESFVENVKVEAEQAVARLRHHPSLAIYAGNNEDYMLAEVFKLPVDWSDLTSDPRNSALPARYIYETILPEVVDRVGGGDVYYHRSSPYSVPGKSTMDLKHGDLHNWNVWHGEQLDYQKWEYMSSRFVSEFGMEGFPDRRTVDHWVGEKKSERTPQSRTSISHNKATGHEKRLAQYLVENFRYSLDMDGYIYATQLLQSEAVASAYRVWRRNWKGRGKEYTAGLLVWQLNDCWPVTSWSLVDYHLRPKPVFYTVARELRPITVGAARYEKKTPVPQSSRVESQFFVAVWGSNLTLEPLSVTLDLQAFDLHDPTFQWKQQKDVVLPPNASTDLLMMPLPGQSGLAKQSEVPRTIIVSARLLDQEGAVVSRNSNWPELFKYIDFPPPAETKLSIKTAAPNNADAKALAKNQILPNKQLDLTGATKITLSSALPIKGVILDADGEADVRWSDQAIDLVPGDEQVVLAWGLDGREVKARCLGDGTVPS